MIEPNELPPESEDAYESPRNSLYSDGEMTPEELRKRLMEVVRAADANATSSELAKKRSAMAASYRSYNNEFEPKSKYKQKAYSSRSKLHPPKTRSAVRHKMVAVHAALFGTEDVVMIKPEDDTDPYQEGSAELNKALLNYRLDRTSHKNGIPWFKIANGAALHAVVTGICVTKQSWRYKERLVEADEGFDPADRDLDWDVVGINGRPMIRKVTMDKPFIEPIAPENVIVDMGAPWWDPVQEGSFFIVKSAMTVGDIRAMMKPGAQHLGGGAWFEIPEQVIANEVHDGSTAVRTSRGKGTDRYSRNNRPAISNLDMVWVYECFVLIDGVDYHFWTLGRRTLLSEPGEVGTAGHYPALHGERPFVMGVGNIEPDVCIPMSHVESWRPLQEEITDTTNLRLDTMKQAIAPIALYRRGANVDLLAVRERGPDATISVGDLDKDLRFERVHGPDPSSYAEMDRLNAQFDEQAGSFAASTIQSNRQLNETVGGLRLLNSSANTIQEFDLQVFIQTWAEPALRQLVWLNQYYETDETLLGLMAKKAGLYQRFGIDAQLDDILEREVTVKVDLGPGAGDPVQKLQRLTASLDLAINIAPFVEGQVKPKAEALLSEIFAASGVSAAKLFDFLTPEEAAQMAQQQPGPEEQRMQLEQQKLQIEAQGQQQEAQADAEKNDLERQKLRLEQYRLAMEAAQMNAQQVLQQDQRLIAQKQYEDDRSLEERKYADQRDMEERRYADERMKHESAQRQYEDQQALAQQQYADQQANSERDYGLRVAGHNKQLVDAASAEAEQAYGPHARREMLPAERAMTDAATQIQQIMQGLLESQQMLAQGQEQQMQFLQAIMQSDQQHFAMLEQMLAEIQRSSGLMQESVDYQKKPKRAVKKNGQWTLEIGDQPEAAEQSEPEE